MCKYTPEAKNTSDIYLLIRTDEKCSYIKTAECR